MSEAFQLTAAQQIRLEVFRRLTVDGRGMYPALAKEIETVSATIIGEATKDADKPTGPRCIVYEGEALIVPDWANYVAADYDGDIWFYRLMPLDGTVQQRVYSISGGDKDAKQSGYELPSLGRGGSDTYPVLAL